MSVRLRFAPSPTGYLHIGGARTALFNWLFVRRHGGTFILRIEDTDVERSSTDMVTGILESLRWLGLQWDEGPIVGGPHAPYFQTERLDRYTTAADRLVAEDKAYHCYCSPEELKAKRERAEVAGGGWIYDRTCANLSREERAARDEAGLPRAVRFRVPAGSTSFDDEVHGRITVAHDTLDDFVIVRSDGYPTYQLSAVVDDAEMQVTHVVRGDDHVSNTPKQILLYHALGAEVPRFAHVPLILGPDKKRLSKRHGATSVGEYERQGYLPDAMVNFLGLLGWSPGAGDQELFTREQLVAAFSLDGISGGNAVFNPEKLDWFNQQYLTRLSTADLTRALEPFLREAGLWNDAFTGGLSWWFGHVLDLLKPRSKRLTDMVAQLRPFVAETVERDPAAVAKHLSGPEILEHLRDWRRVLHDVDPFDAATLEAALRAVAERRGIKAGVLIHASRVAVTGQTASAGIFEVLELVGRDRVLQRLDEVISATS